jgi:cytochrome c-type biogenesis protein CcmE
MNKKYIIGGAIAVLFAVLAIFAFDTSKIEYADFQKAKETGKIVQVSGSWLKEMDYHYDSQNNLFSYNMIDEHGNEAKVVYNGAKPNNFDIAPMVVIKGKYQDDTFHADEILTKCPSKYEGEFEQLEGQQLYN